jgi:hypothetical protein
MCPGTPHRQLALDDEAAVTRFAHSHPLETLQDVPARSFWCRNRNPRMKEPLEPPRRHLMVSRSRVRLLLGHLCAKRPENPAVASRVYAHGEARVEEERSNIEGGQGGTQASHVASASPLLREPQHVQVGLIKRCWSLCRGLLLRKQRGRRLSAGARVSLQAR